ncbi:MAG: class I SAM-dependent methyltransferase [Haloferacaceae archaeon]
MTAPASDDVARTQQFYSRWARFYDLLATRAPLVQSLREAVVDALDPAPGDAVVEMGCGTGANFQHLRERVGPGGTVVGVDFSPGMLARARERVAAEGWENVHVVRGDAARPPVEEADAVLATFVVGMLPDPATAVGDWADLVGRGGRLALLDLARSTGTAGRPLNGLFRLAVLATSPPGTRRRHARSPTAVLDRRTVAAHRRLDARCGDVTFETRALGFVRVSGGRVA